MQDSYTKLKEQIPSIKKKIGYSFKNDDLILHAFIHRSFINEHRDLSISHNERLEFLGDSVLGLIVAEALYETFPDSPEGDLSQARSRLVDFSSCAFYLEKIDLQDCILLGKGEEKNQGKSKTSILANVFEAILGAIFLDGGFVAAKEFITRHFIHEMKQILESPSKNYKADLQDYSQRQFQKPPVYKVTGEEGPDHAKIFHVIVVVGDKELGEGKGSSKKDAEQSAAKAALKNLEEADE